MAEFTINDLTQVLRECAGEDETVNLDGDIMDSTFEELGYDSLALFNTVGRIERDRAVTLPDDVVSEAKTPRALLHEISIVLGKSVIA